MTTTKKYIIFAAVITLLLGIIAGLSARLSKVAEERDTQKSNVSSLMLSVEQYKTKDSLQAATVGQLELTKKQYEELRAEDLKIIETLKVDNKRLQGVITTQTEQYYQHTAALRDSIKILGHNEDGTPQTEVIKTAAFADEWHSLSIAIENDSVNYKLATREQLIITNHVIPKRFLWFKFGCKEVRNDVVSKNPYTQKIQIESITIK